MAAFKSGNCVRRSLEDSLPRLAALSFVPAPTPTWKTDDRAGSAAALEIVRRKSRRGFFITPPFHRCQEYVYLMAKRFCVNWAGFAATRLANCCPTV